MKKFKSPCGLTYGRHSVVSLHTDNAVIKLESQVKMIDEADIEQAISIVREFNHADMRALRRCEHSIQGVRLTVRPITFRL